jgi:hypothetical protein
MKEQLRWWRDLTTEKKHQLMQENNIKTMTFEKIEELYNMLKFC